jgi:hypothetical protein
MFISNFTAGGGGALGNFTRGGNDSGGPSGKKAQMISSGIVAGLLELFSRYTQSVAAFATNSPDPAQVNS